MQHLFLYVKEITAVGHLLHSVFLKYGFCGQLYRRIQELYIAVKSLCFVRIHHKAI